MPAGTIALTNNSSAATGTGTSFDTEISAGDFLSAVVGQVRYTLGIKSVDSATGITLIRPFNGPSASGLAWTPIPRDVLVDTTAQIAADQGFVIRGFVLDKANWQQVFSDEDDITVTLPDGSQFQGPSWRKISELLATLDVGSITEIAAQIHADAEQVATDKPIIVQAKNDAMAANAAAQQAEEGARAADQSAQQSKADATTQAEIAKTEADRAKAEADRAAAANPANSMLKAQNLNDVADKAESRNNLEVFSKQETKALLDACFPIGIPVYWPSATLPDNSTYGIKFLRWNGGVFSTTTYPKLAAIFTSGTLPDARGDVLRVWDDSRGIDPSRTLLSEQASAAPNIKGHVAFSARSGGATSSTGAFTSAASISANTGSSTAAPTFDGADFDAKLSSSVYQDGITELRVRNMALNFIVRAN